MPSKLDFSHRAHLSEWMDEPCSYPDFRDCLRDLAHATPRTEPLHIVDVGSGGGDMLRRIERWAARNRLPVRLTGIDLNPYAAQAAREATPPSSAIHWVTGDAFSFTPAAPIDLILSSLFTHHLPDEEIVRFLAWMESSARLGWFISDLHREPAPYYGFQLLANIARWHRFVRHDGPISIRRAFQPADWHACLASAAIPPGAAQVFTMRPARLCVSRIRP
jgi:SAM-dependent methyltransferase